MLKIKNTNIWPSQIDEIVFGFPEVIEYQGELYIGDRGRDEARIRVAFADSDEDGGARPHELAAELRCRLEVRFDVIAVPRAELPVFATAEKKARRWQDHRQSQLADGSRS